MKKTVATALMGVTLTAGAARADMSFSAFMFNALDASGSPITNGTYVMLIDVDGDGYGIPYNTQSVLTDNTSSWQWDADDFLLDRGEISNGEAFPFRNLATGDKPAAFEPGDAWYMLWFDTPFNALAAGPGVGVNYGVEQLVDPLASSGLADPGDYAADPEGGVANLTTTPEPASLLLLGLGSLAIARRRKG